MEDAGRRPAARRSEGLAEESVWCLREALGQLRDIWEEIGIPEEQRLERTQVVKTYVQELLGKMIAEERGLQQRLLRSVEVWRGQLAALCRELHLPPPLPAQETSPSGGSSLLQREKELRGRVEALRREKEERRQALEALREQERDLCDLLALPPSGLAPAAAAGALPTPDELDRLRHHLAALAAEKERRQAEFAATKRQIVACMEELEHVPDSTFQREVVCEEEEVFCLSEDNLAALRALLQQLEARKAQEQALCKELRSRILVLWDRLRVPAQERESLAPHVAGSRSKTTLHALQSELSRLETLKLQNIRNMVEAIRVELADYWDKCFYSKEQRESFGPYYQDDFTEELLQQHEEEMAHIKLYFEKHQEVFEAICKWEGNWHLFQELERKATDPSRFNNRGGNLLKEEKLRAKLQKALPKLEEELRGRLELWEQEHGQAFLVNGRRFMEHVAEQRQLHQLEKEREKQERQLKKSRQIEEEMMYGSTPCTPSKRRVLGTTTPSKARKLNTTVATPNSTIRSALGGSVFHSPASHPPPSGSKPPQSLRTPCRTAAKPSRPGRLEQNKENVSQLNGIALSGGCTSTAPAQRTHSINSVAGTYFEFAQELSKASKSENRPRILNSTVSMLDS